jgi:ABC-type maltose transport system permease subunit
MLKVICFWLWDLITLTVGLCRVTPLSTLFQLYYIVAVSFIVGGNRSTQRKSPTCHKSLTNYNTIFAALNYNWEVDKFYYIILFSSFSHIVKWWFRLIIFNVDADNNFKCTLLHNNWHLLLRSRHKVKFVYKGSL